MGVLPGDDVAARKAQIEAVVAEASARASLFARHPARD